jgi:DnaK suppressor protein
MRLRETLVREYNARSEALRLARERGGRDLIDDANEQQARREMLAEMKVEGLELSEIDAALQRIWDGTYGVCEASGEPIPEARLRAIPWTRFTLRHAAYCEQLRKQSL